MQTTKDARKEGSIRHKLFRTAGYTKGRKYRIERNAVKDIKNTRDENEAGQER